MSDQINIVPTVDLEKAKKRVMGDMDFLKELMGEFSKSIPSYLETIRRALGAKDFSLLSKTTHKLKGAALNLSVNLIAEKATEVNELGKQENFALAESAMQELESAVLDFEAYLQKDLW